MSYIISVVSQKGGVGKSTIARMLATALVKASNGTGKIMIADTDTSQSTCYEWVKRRLQDGTNSKIEVIRYFLVEDAIADAVNYDIMIIDGAPQASRDTLTIALASQIVVIPTGNAQDDLDPTIKLAWELEENGVPNSSIVFGICRCGDSPIENLQTIELLGKAGFRVASGSLPGRTGYRRASDEGLAVTETLYPSLNERANEFCRSLMHQLYEVEQSKGLTK